MFPYFEGTLEVGFNFAHRICLQIVYSGFILRSFGVHLGLVRKFRTQVILLCTQRQSLKVNMVLTDAVYLA